MIPAVAAAAMLLLVMSAGATIVAYDRSVNYSQYLKYDRFLDVEIWTDGEEYYSGDNIRISFQADENCYVAIYNIDTRGRVNLLFPDSPAEDNWIEGNRIYRLPAGYDDYQLTVHGPEGIEFLHIIASRHPFPIPDWFGGSGLVCDDDPYDFIDYIDAVYFACEGNCAQAFDLTSFTVNEWNDYYFRPVYRHHHHHYHYPDWDWWYYGGVYIDYPFGATIYIDGIYWGIAPLFIPRIYYGWHHITIYDSYGYCWEDRIHVYKRKSIVLDRTHINPRAGIKSRFKEVRKQGYLAPERNGYPEYKKQVAVKKSLTPVKSVSVDGKYRVKADPEKSAAGYRSKYDQSGRSAATKKRSDSRQSTFRSKSNSERSLDSHRSGDSYRSKETRSSKTTTTRRKSDRSYDSPSRENSGKSYDTKRSTDRKRESSSSGSVRQKSSSSGSSGSGVKSSSGRKSSPSGSVSGKSSGQSGSGSTRKKGR